MADATAVELATTGSNLLGRLSDLRSRGVARVLAVVAAVRLRPASLTIDLEPAAVAEALGFDASRIASEALTVVTPLALRRRGIETRIVVGPLEPAPDATLLGALRKAHRWAGEIRARVSIRDIAAREKTSESYVARVAHLALLSPAVQRAIVEGKQPADLTLAVLLRSALPLDWRAQEIRLGLAR